MRTVFYKLFSHWTLELNRKHQGLKPRLWFALFQYFRAVLLLHGLIFLIEVSGIAIDHSMVGFQFNIH